MPQKWGNWVKKNAAVLMLQIGNSPEDDLGNKHLHCKLEIVINEMRKNQNFHFDLQIHPTLISSTYLNCQMIGFIPIRVQNFQNVD